jgi:hypothetical protein
LIIATAGLILVPLLANADCMKNSEDDVICGKGECQRDMYGVILCAAYRDGTAVLTSDGRILCGKGECVKTLAGEIFCSTEREGTAMKDIHGVVHCDGQCELASVDYCEARPAGTAPE